MCDPVAYAVFSAGKAVVDYKAASSSAKTINANAQANAANIRQEAIFSDNVLIRKKERETEKLSEQKYLTNLKAKKVSAQAKVNIGEKGIGGNVVDTLLGDIDRQRGFAFSTIDNNYEEIVRGIDDNRQATNRGYVNQILSLPRAVKPSFLPYALKAGADIAFTFSSVKPPATPKPPATVGRTSGIVGGINLDSLYSGLT